jgi:hypothetical protein
MICPPCGEILQKLNLLFLYASGNNMLAYFMQHSVDAGQDLANFAFHHSNFFDSKTKGSLYFAI